jgi:hypothetical protein
MSHMANIVDVYCFRVENFCYFKTLMYCINANIKRSESVEITPGPTKLMS